MRKALLVVFATLLPALIIAQTRPVVPSRPLAFVHVTIIDATGAPPKPDMTVVISGGRITAIETSTKLEVPDGARVVDGTGKFLIPGLWDMHIHLDDSELWPLHVSREEKEMIFPLLIANGITGVRDMGGSLEQLQQWRQRITLGQLLGPRIFMSGPFVDGNSAAWLGTVQVTTEAEGRAAVRSLSRRGADFIKVYNSIPRPAYFGIADEAKRLGIDFAGHIPDLITAAEASDAGQKSVEHMIGILLSCSTNEDAFRREVAETYDDPNAPVTPLVRGDPAVLASFSKEKCALLFARFRKNGTWQCPTLHNNWRHAHSFDSALMNDPRVRYYPKRFRFYERLPQLVREMQQAGVGILAGSDAGANEYSVPGFSLHDELAEFVDAGLTPMEALQTATLNPARYFGMTDAFGTVELGKTADLILLEANPLDNIRNTQKIAGVILNGRLISKPELQKMLSDAEAAANQQ